MAKGRNHEKHNWFGGELMDIYNRSRVFGNLEDEEKGLEEGLKAVYEEVEIKIVGMVALFVCRRPRR